MHHKNSIFSIFLMGGFLALSLAACEPPPPGPYDPKAATTTMGQGVTTTTAKLPNGTTTTSTTTTVPTQPPLPLEEAWLREARKKFGEGKIVFKPPEEMAADKTETLEARITFRTEAIGDVVDDIKGSGPTKIEPLKVSCRMKVALIAEKEDFRITPITKEERYLDPQEPYTSWKWDVTPLKLGTHAIHLVAEAMVERSGYGNVPLYVRTFDYEIRVKVKIEIGEEFD